MWMIRRCCKQFNGCPKGKPISYNWISVGQEKPCISKIRASKGSYYINSCFSSVFGLYSKTCIVKVRAAWGHVSRGLTVRKFWNQKKGDNRRTRPMKASIKVPRYLAMLKLSSKFNFTDPWTNLQFHVPFSISFNFIIKMLKC